MFFTRGASLRANVPGPAATSITRDPAPSGIKVEARSEKGPITHGASAA